MAILKNVEVQWCKLLGEPRTNYNEDGKEWSVDFLLDDDQIKELESNGFSADFYLKKKERGSSELKVLEDGRKILTYRRPEKNADDKENKRVIVIDGEGMPWEQEKLIGNGSIVDIQYNVFELAAKRGNPKRGKLALIKMMVRELVPFESEGSDEGFDLPGETKVKEDWSEDAE